jgi:plastocyanin
MRKIFAIVIVLTLAAFSASAMDQAEHLDHLRMMLAAMSSHGPVIPQPETISGNVVQTINISARSFSFTPSSFTVNQGDVVTINITVPSGDGSTIGHGILMSTYIEDGIDVGKGKTETTTFTATTAGTFAFVCTQPSCGTGHTSMIGQMIVHAASLAITDVSPTAGTIAGGTQITITGLSFQDGATVTVGGSLATNVNVVSATTITATTPAHVAGSVDVIVTSGGTTVTKSSGFLYFDPKNNGPRHRAARH